MPRNSTYNGKEKSVCFIEDITRINGAITKPSLSDRQLAAYLYENYHDFAKKCDVLGRTALHMSASCGRSELARWLIEVAGANINSRDLESGYTPLQRALFHGHLGVAVRLLQLGADERLQDKEGLTALDLVVKDRPPRLRICRGLPSQVYLWGSNDNYTLGTGTNKSRRHPELLDNFKRRNVSIEQVYMDEYHSLFLSGCGRAWVCGSGEGGRLGQAVAGGGSGSGRTSRQLTTPRQLSLGAEGAVSAAIALNHTLILLSNGNVMGCGSNEHCQLGLSPWAREQTCLKPLPVAQVCATQPLVGLAAGRYHSVFYTRTSIYSCGLNGGQLGHPHLQNQPYVRVPTQVPVKLKAGSHISQLACSSACLVFSASSGEVYSLYQFQFTKIASKQLDVCQIATSGGCLNTKLVTETNPSGSSPLRIVLLSSSGTLQIWQETNPTFKRCMFGLSRLISISYIFLNESKILFTTKDGEAFQGTIGQIEKQNVSSCQDDSKSGFHKFVEKSECYHISSHRIPNVHRALSITSDPKGKNMAVIQVHPGSALSETPLRRSQDVSDQFASLLQEASLDDSLHDIVFKVDGRVFPAHEYIVACTDSSLLSLPRSPGGVIELSDLQPAIFEEILSFIYTGWSSLLTPGPLSISLSSSKDDPVKLLTEAANKYKILSLYKKIVCFRYEKGCIRAKEGCSSLPDRRTAVEKTCSRFSRTSHPELHDVQLSSEDGTLIPAHKCILVARLDYFHHMLMGGWLETGSSRVLHLSCPQSILTVILDFLYTNQIPDWVQADSAGFETLSRLLVMSDQLLCTELKEETEHCLVRHCLSLKNAGPLLSLAFLYSTTRLKTTLMQFISLNLETLLESRALEELSDEMLEELSRYHRKLNSTRFDRRIITPPMEEGSSNSTIDTEQLILSASSLHLPWISASSENVTLKKMDLKGKDEKQPTMQERCLKKRNTTIKKSPPLGIPQQQPPPGGQQRETRVVSPPQATAPISPPAPASPPAPSSPPAASSPPAPAAADYEHALFQAFDFPQIENLSLSSNNKSNLKVRRPPGDPCGGGKLRVTFRKLLKEQQRQAQQNQLPLEKSPPQQKSVFKGWAVLSPPPPSLSQRSPDTNERQEVSSPPEASSFVEIIASEQQARQDYFKMKGKPFLLTQMEDKAIEELSEFYSASTQTEERITVRRVNLHSYQHLPIWIKTNKTLFH